MGFLRLLRPLDCVARLSVRCLSSHPLWHNVAMDSLTAPNRPSAGWQWPTEWQWPTDMRKFMCWIFLATSLQYATISLRSIPSATNQFNSLPFFQNLLIAPVLSVVMTFVSGIASWTIWKGKPAAKGWAVAASLIYILIFLRQFVIPLRPIWHHHVTSLFVGAVGLAAFLWPDRQVGV